jgi:hypothetical protein
LHAAIPIGKSLEELRRCAETQIDPQVVNALRTRTHVTAAKPAAQKPAVLQASLHKDHYRALDCGPPDRRWMQGPWHAVLYGVGSGAMVRGPEGAFTPLAAPSRRRPALGR